LWKRKCQTVSVVTDRPSLRIAAVVEIEVEIESVAVWIHSQR
jgi:hypothetical protein